MDSAFVYLPDDEPDSSQMFNGHIFTLRPRGTTEIVPYDAAVAKDEARLAELEGPRATPTGKVMVRWPGITPSVVADHIAEHQKRWGVVRTNGPVVNGKAENVEDQAAVNAAEWQYLVGTKDWAEQMILDDRKRNAPREEAGLPPIVSPEATKARAWLANKAAILQAAGLA